MKHILIANVGNSDIRFKGELSPTQDKSARSLGNYLLSNYTACKQHIEIPLILPTLTWIKGAKGIENPDIEVVLIASDQDKTYTPADEYKKDTKPYADIIQRYLIEMDEKGKKTRLQKNQVRIETIDANPADYSTALDFQHRTLVKLKTQLDKKYAQEGYHVYLEVSGGTPAMCSMLIVTGAEVFGTDVTTLYLDRSSTTPNPIDIGRVLYSRQARDSFKQQVGMYAYGVATKTLEAQSEFIVTDAKRMEVMKGLVQYADRRLSFDFATAREHLEKAQLHIVGVQQSKIRYWLGELREMTTQNFLAELLYTMKIKIEIADYIDLTQRMFRFQESIFRHLAEQMGIEYSKSDKQHLNSTWLEAQSQQGLQFYLSEYRRDSKGAKTSKPNKVETHDRGLNRFSLGAIVDYYVESVDQWKPLYETVQSTHRLSEVADLRNKGVSGHGFDGVSLEIIKKAYGAPIDDMLKNCEQIYCDVFKVEQMPILPYQAVNELLLELLEEAQ